MLAGMIIGLIIGSTVGLLTLSLLKTSKESDKYINGTEEIKLLNITQGVYNTYINTVKNNKNENFLMSRKKITRNWYLAKFIKCEGNQEWRNYGNLHLCLDKNTGTIIWIENIKWVAVDEFKVDEDRKRELEGILGIKKYNKNNTYKNEKFKNKNYDNMNYKMS